MFEIADFIKARKESKDKITRVISAWSVREETIHEEGFQDGAIFGYNKAKEEMQEQGLALQSDMDKTIEQNIQLKKQNNWLEGCKLELAEHLGKANDRVSELEQQIEKMKCCENCKHHCFWGNELNCRTLPYDEELKCMKTREYWEIKEND